MDILVYYWGRSPIAFLHRDSRMVAEAYARVEVVPGTPEWYTNTATFADIDGDGHPDLVVGDYFPDDSHLLDARASNRVAMQSSMSRANNGGGLRFH